MTPRVKRIGLGAALAATLCAAWYAPDDEGSGVARPVAPTASRSVPPAPAFLDVLAIRPRMEEDDTPDASLFETTEWGGLAAAAPVAAAPVDAAPAAAAAAPPLPFRVMGSFEQAGQTIVFLQQNDLNHAVRAGDTIGATYKVESVTGAVMTLRYLPLNQVQTLDLGHTLQDKRELE